MFLSREIDAKLCQNYTKSHIYYVQSVQSALRHQKLRPMTVQYNYVTKTLANSRAVYWSRVSLDNDTALLLAEVLMT